MQFIHTQTETFLKMYTDIGTKLLVAMKILWGGLSNQDWGKEKDVWKRILAFYLISVLLTVIKWKHIISIK